MSNGAHGVCAGSSVVQIGKWDVDEAEEGKKKSRPSFDDLLDCLWVCDYTARSTLLERKHLVQT